MMDFLFELYQDGRLNVLKENTSLKYSTIEKSFVVKANDAFYSLNTDNIMEALEKFYEKEILSCPKTASFFHYLKSKMHKIILKRNNDEVEFRAASLLEAWHKVIYFLGGRLSSNRDDFDIYSFGYTWCKLPSKIDGCKDSTFRIKLGQIAKHKGFRAWCIDSCNYPLS